MCGIAGIVALSREGGCFSSNLQAMAKRIRHRGPDDEGYLLGHFSSDPVSIFRGDDTPSFEGSKFNYLSDKHIVSQSSCSANVFFAHRRLSILDLTVRGHQPIATKDGRYWMVFNGEIYNYREIAGQLLNTDYAVSGESDSEVLLAAYAYWGKAALHKLNGMFSLAIWDDVKKQLFCARDRIGIKPFYYTLSRGRFLFCSEVKGIIASGLYKPKPDLQGLYDSLSYGTALRPDTCFVGVQELLPGHMLTLEFSGEVNVERYWTPNIEVKQNLREEEAEERVVELLIDSVRLRTHADVPVSTFMSGGVDSTLITALSTLNSNQPMAAFTMDVGESAIQRSELKEAQATARMYPNLQHVVCAVDPATIVDNLDEQFSVYEDPFCIPSPNFLILREVMKHNYKVVLSGIGGDELFAGYPYYQFLEKLRRLRVFGLTALAAMPLFKMLRLDQKRLYTLAQVGRYGGSIAGYYATMRNNAPELFKRDAFPSAQKDTVLRFVERYGLSPNNAGDSFQQTTYYDLLHYIGNHQMTRLDNFSMHFSLEARVPFFDHRLVELALSLPPQYKVNAGVGKYLLKKVAKKYIAPQCLSMKKSGFGMPVAEWLAGPLSGYADEKLTALRARGVFRSSFIDKVTKYFKRGSFPDGQLLWLLVATEAWFEAYID